MQGRWPAAVRLTLLACAVLALFCSLVRAGPAQATAPRVALLFLTRGNIPLEPAWRMLLEGVQGMEPPALSTSQVGLIMQDKEVGQVQQQLQEAGSLQANSLLMDAHVQCVDDSLLKVRPIAKRTFA